MVTKLPLLCNLRIDWFPSSCSTFSFCNCWEQSQFSKNYVLGKIEYCGSDWNHSFWSLVFVLYLEMEAVAEWWLDYSVNIQNEEYYFHFLVECFICQNCRIIIVFYYRSKVREIQKTLPSSDSMQGPLMRYSIYHIIIEWIINKIIHNLCISSSDMLFLTSLAMYSVSFFWNHLRDVKKIKANLKGSLNTNHLVCLQPFVWLYSLFVVFSLLDLLVRSQTFHILGFKGCQGLKITWIWACPSDKQLPNFACRGSCMLVRVYFFHDLVTRRLAWVLAHRY